MTLSPLPDEPSRPVDFPGRKLETFSYLEPMTPEQLRAQVGYIVGQGWTPAIEHTEPENASRHYWYMWKLPLFGERDVERILAEAAACRRAYPAHLIRLVGYDTATQSQGTAMVIYRGQSSP